MGYVGSGVLVLPARMMFPLVPRFALALAQALACKMIPSVKEDGDPEKTTCDEGYG